MFINGEPSKLTEFTHSPRKDRRTPARKSHFGGEGQDEQLMGISVPAASSLSAGGRGRSYSTQEHPRSSVPPLPLSPRRLERSASKLHTSNAQSVCRRRFTVRVLAAIGTICSVLPWLCSRTGNTGVNLRATPSSLAVPPSTANAGTAASEGDEVINLRALEAVARCESRKNGGVPAGRAQCVPFLPGSVIENEGWLVGIHVDRAPAEAQGGLRGGDRAAHRELPHQYFVRAMHATLNSISTVDHGANVDLVVFSEGRFGGMVDEMGVPVEWDIPHEICEEIGLVCTKVRVFATNVQVNGEKL